MKKNLTTVDFHGTKEQEEALIRICEEYDCNPDNLMPILQQAQELYGYLPIDVQRIIAAKCHVSLEEVYGIVTFYSQFALNPKGEVAIAVCLGTACYVKGSGKIIERIQEKMHLQPGMTTPDGKVSLEATRCIGACGLAPVLTVNGTVYGRLAPEDVDGILSQYLGA